MPKAWNLQEPTPEQIEQTKRVERALIGELDLLAKEGVPLAALLAGLGSSAAALIASRAGQAAVAPWFDRQARLVEELQGGGH